MATGSEALVDRLPSGQAVTHLPALGPTQRNPDFWSDRDVRGMVIVHHRQMTVEECRAAISAAVGTARTPSKSALARVWKRLDLLRAPAKRGAR